MRKIIVIAVILAVLATPAFASWSYYKGTGSDGWGVVPTTVDTVNGGWTVRQPNGGSASENGCLYTDIAYNGNANVKFTVNSTNLPDCSAWGGEGDSSVWCEVYVVSLTSAGGDAEAQKCMAGSAGPWVDKMTSNHQYNDYWGTGISGQWQSLYQWKNDPTHYAKPGGGTLSAAGMHYLGLTGNPPHDANGNGYWFITDARNISVNLTGVKGDIFIGIKTGIYNAGADASKGGPNDAASTYGQHITTFNLVPEPGSLLALGSGLLGLMGFVIRRKK